ncbi:MAG: thiamine-binding protein [Treponema sp.]|nr:thiamine-binding protein [Treponema sp.]
MNKPEASLAIQVLPQSVASDTMLGIVDKVIAYLKLSGLKMAVGPFETVIEGGFEELMGLAAECQRICIREGADGLLTYMKMAYNPHGGVLSIDEKIAKYNY